MNYSHFLWLLFDFRAKIYFVIKNPTLIISSTFFVCLYLLLRHNFLYKRLCWNNRFLSYYFLFNLLWSSLYSFFKDPVLNLVSGFFHLNKVLESVIVCSPCASVTIKMHLRSHEMCRGCIYSLVYGEWRTDGRTWCHPRHLFTGLFIILPGGLLCTSACVYTCALWNCDWTNTQTALV